MTFIADHNSTRENFSMLEIVCHKQTLWEAPLGTQECFQCTESKYICMYPKFL